MKFKKGDRVKLSPAAIAAGLGPQRNSHGRTADTLGTIVGITVPRVRWDGPAENTHRYHEDYLQLAGPAVLQPLDGILPTGQGE